MRLSVQTKLLGAFGVVVALMLVLGLFSLSRLSSDNRHLKQLASVVVPSTRAVGDIASLMNKYRKDQLHYIVAKPADRPLSAPGSIQGDLNDDLTQMARDFGAYRSQGLIEDSTDLGLLKSFESSFYRYIALTAGFERLADRNQAQRSADLVGAGSGDHQWDKLKSDIAAWNDHKVETAAAASTSSRRSYSDGVRLIVALLIVALVIAVIVAVVLARRTTRAVRQIGVAAEAISHGEIDQRVDVRSRDELGDMAAHFEEMIGYLRGTVAIAETIAAGDLDVAVRPRSSRDALGNALLGMTESLRSVNAENQRLLSLSREEAKTDALTGLPNRRALTHDLETQLADAGPDHRLMLALFDLDGFKEYNDTFGHPAGDALLTRVGDRLQKAVADAGCAYRMGGDEFCVLARADHEQAEVLAARAASGLSEKGEAFSIGCSYGVANLPLDAATAPGALRVADDRMYDHKTSRVSASRQSTDVLLKVLGERSPGLMDHLSQVAYLAALTAESLGFSLSEVKRTRLAAELHDVGKVAIPDTILNKPGPLDEEEWEFMRCHTEIGERIINAAPSLCHVGQLVRSSHERHDGRGYPDRLAGEDIPAGARVIAVCDAFDAMTSPRPYSEAMAIPDAIKELRRCSGSQFDPEVVRAFCEVAESLESDPLSEARAA